MSDNEILDAFAEEVDAVAEGQDTVDLAGNLDSNLKFTKAIKTRLRNSINRESLLTEVEETIKERQKALLCSLKSGNLTNKKMNDVVEAFRQLTVKLCNIMGHKVNGHPVIELALYEEVLALLRLIPKGSDNVDRTKLLKFVFNSMNLQVKLLLKGNSDRITDMQGVMEEFAEHMNQIALAQLGPDDEAL
jgi:hypothetical protein